MKRKYLEPYAKENNLLQLSLFYFGSKPPKETAIEWEDEKGSYRLSCSCSKGVPGGLEQDVFTAAMRIWVKRGMTSDPIEVSYSDIARELNVSPRDWNRKIKKSLGKLGQARYLFDECFIVADEDGNNRISTHFSLFDYSMLFSEDKDRNKKKGKSKLALAELVRKNLESKYYQYLDMVWYRALPSGLPRRLYEFLEKKRYLSKNHVFVIGEEPICRWLPIVCKTNPSMGRKTLAKTAKHLIEAGYLKAYSFDKKKKLCFFSYSDARTSPIEGEENVIDIATKETSPKKIVPSTLPELTELDRLVSLLRLKRVPKAIKNILAKHLKENGAAYVERNINYANEKAKTSYSNYLSMCLENDYANAWQEEKDQKQETLFDLNEELKKKHQKEEDKKKRYYELEKLRSEFLKEVEGLSSVFKRMALESAERKVGDSPAKQFAIKPAYSNRILDIVNEIGGNYPEEILTIDIMKKLWSQKIEE